MSDYESDDYESDDELGFDVQDTAPQEELRALPPGEYRCVVVAAAIEPYGEGKCLSLRLQVAEGEHQNQIIFARHAVVHGNEKCQQIGRAMVSSLARATGVLNPSRAAEFLDHVVVAKVKIKPPKNGYSESNDVSIYKSAAVASVTPAKQGQQQMVVPPPSTPANVPANPFE